MNGNKSFMLTLFLAGLGAGIALTALMAPQSGAATRRLIRRKIEGGEDWVKGQAAAAEDCVTASAAGLRDRVKDLQAAAFGRTWAVAGRPHRRAAPLSRDGLCGRRLISWRHDPAMQPLDFRHRIPRLGFHLRSASHWPLDP